MTNFERITRSKEDLAKQLTWERCSDCDTMPRCKIEQRKTCLNNTMEWLDQESEVD